MKLKFENKDFIFDKPQKCGLKYLIKSFLVHCYSVCIKMWMNLFHPHKKVQKLYNVSICAIFKNEALYLKEWIEFHKIVGIDHFYMYNNNSEDNYSEILDPYIKEGTITLVQWTKNQAQMEAYKDAAERFSNETKWLGFIDIDEFVTPIKYNDIYSFLKKFEKNRGSVMIYWKIFGTSGFVDRNINNFVIKDFTVCWDKHINIGKCFYNTNYKLATSHNELLHHCLWAKYGGINLPPVNQFDKLSVCGRHKAKSSGFDIQINHYFTKSYNEYLNKKAKGDVYFKINPHDEEYFFEHEMKCVDVDYSAYKYLIKMNQQFLRCDFDKVFKKS